MDKLMTRLAYSKLITPRGQAIHLIINYSLLALACIVYLIFSTPVWVIELGALPGALIFLISLQGFAFRKALDGDDDMISLLSNFIR